MKLRQTILSHWTRLVKFTGIDSIMGIFARNAKKVC
jgi:hypothetical protein